ncbi:coiled-coil domain-containing protein [Streptomyces millisiae]|uniref:Secreted protein n=1 Tax=Streptomyces millisiae TaxID=3075542 RepID=A0ABU2LNM8_9ACTN|nr:hypothetical protein [Streptomyces sp. DSM 44918]MDT0318673.1 hypothetical protein [Streptomyces sp. DSM 44918]
MDILITLLGLSFLAFLVVAGLVVWGARAVARRAAHARDDIRRTFTDAMLNARAAQPGAVGDAARTRRELRAALDSTRAALRADASLAEARALFEQLTGHAQQLDRELTALMTGEPDRARLAARLPELRTRADRIRRSADSLRFAAQERAHRHDTEALDALHDQIDLEANALRHWTPAPAPEAPPQATPPGLDKGTPS